MKLFHSLIAKLFGKNLQSTPKDVIVDQMNEPRPLPMGRKEFEEWSERIIAGAMVPCAEEHKEKLKDSQLFVLCGSILHVSPTESHKPDAYFIHTLRKSAANEVAHQIGLELNAKKKEREAKEKENDAVLN
jgi:hypothetical protein